MSPRQRDACWDALVRATEANEEFTGGRIGSALRAIRAAAKQEGIGEDQLPGEIERRCAIYRKRWPNLFITPTAIAAHWFRITTARAPSAEEQSLNALRQREL